ncbi:MAG TPA: hypothetical protein VGK93_08735, partial [Candidatus Eisenbacteria bacterium]
ACPGCSGGTCLVLNSVLVKRPPRPEGAPTTDVLVTTPGNGNGNWAILATGRGQLPGRAGAERDLGPAEGPLPLMSLPAQTRELRFRKNGTRTTT